MSKRWRAPKARPGVLKAVFGKYCGDLDLYYAWGGSGANKCDGMMLSNFFEEVKGLHGTTLRQELEKRGYDITTFKFSIQQKVKPVAQ